MLESIFCILFFVSLAICAIYGAFLGCETNYAKEQKNTLFKERL